MTTPPSSASRPAAKGSAAKAGVDALTFEKALGEIESIIERIESGEIGLEDSLAQYERGVLLVNHCRGKLDAAQQQVEDLTRRLERADEGDQKSGGVGNEADADDPES